MTPAPNQKRRETHAERMARKRTEQLLRAPNCSPFGRKLVWTTRRMPDGTSKRVQVGVERTDEQGEYRAKHWRKTEGELLHG